MVSIRKTITASCHAAQSRFTVAMSCSIVPVHSGHLRPNKGAWVCLKSTQSAGNVSTPHVKGLTHLLQVKYISMSPPPCSSWRPWMLT